MPGGFPMPHRRLLDQAAFHRLARAGRAPAAAVQRVSVTRGRVVDEVRRKIRFCFSDDTVDRMNDRIFASAWDLKNFARSPVVLWSHDASQPPIGRASNVRVEGNRLMGDIEFMSAELYPFSDLIYRLAKGGWINSVSVGFLPREWTRSTDPARTGGFDYTRVELLEVSSVPVPAQSNALIEARRMGCPPRQIARLCNAGGRKDAQDDDELPLADCGRDEDQPCGLIDGSECETHGGDDPESRARRKVKALMRSVDRRSAMPEWKWNGNVADFRRHVERLQRWHRENQ
jgi:HK97 family phage prohead protease